MASTRPHQDVDDKPQHDEGPTEKISCVECRRLKRKCDRIHPCNQCRRYDKTCVFPQPEVPRRGKRYLAEVKGRVERLERLLAQHAPHVDIEDENSPEESKSGVGAMMVPTQTAAGFRSAVSSAVSHERGQHPPPPLPHTPLDIFAAPSNMMATEATGSPGRHNRVATVGANNVPSVSPASSLGMFSDNAGSGSIPRRPPPVAQPSTARGQQLQGPQQPQFPSSTAEAYERQPRNASGYEWNERQGRIGENDGTASLSVEPDGEGYLGFASGATLLRILQMTAGGISLKGIPEQDVEPPAPAHWQPSHGQLQLFMDGYFATYHTQYPIIHEHTFRAQVNEVVAQPPLKQWQVLYNVVLGLGAFCESQPMYVVDYFMERAISQISVDHLETGSLVLVQAFTLLSNLAQKRNKPNAGSTYLGIAVRMAIGLGLHRELPLWNIKPFDREVRRRVWWVVYIFDSGASITFGRPILLPYGEADVRIVHNVQDRHFTPHSPSVPPSSREKTIYSALIWQSLFHIIGNGCYDRVIATPPPTAEEALDLDRELLEWYTTVPEWMQARATPDMFPDTPWLYFSAHKLFWRYSNLRIILHRRAFLDRALKGLPMAGGATPGMELDHTLAATCIDSAMDTIYDIHGFFKARAPNRLETWYALHFLFQASFVPLIAMHTDPSSASRGTWGESVRLACETLHAVQGDPLASRCLRIIDLLMPSMTAPQVEVPTLLDFFSANPMFQGTSEVQDLLPFADLATLMSFWPQNQGA